MTTPLVLIWGALGSTVAHLLWLAHCVGCGRLLAEMGAKAPPDQVPLLAASEHPAEVRYRRNSGPLSPHPARCPLTASARSALTGTSTRAVERGGGFGATAYVSGIIAAAIAAIATFSAARLGRSREVSSAIETARVCACVSMFAATVRLDAAAAAAAPPGPRTLVAHD